MEVSDRDFNFEGIKLADAMQIQSMFSGIDLNQQYPEEMLLVDVWGRNFKFGPNKIDTLGEDGKQLVVTRYCSYPPSIQMNLNLNTLIRLALVGSQAVALLTDPSMIDYQMVPGEIMNQYTRGGDLMLSFKCGECNNRTIIPEVYGSEHYCEHCGAVVSLPDRTEPI